MDKLSAVGRLFAEAVFLVAELRRQRLAEISGLEHRPDFDLARAGHRIGAALYPRDCLGHVLDLPEPETGDQLAGLGKRAVNDGAAWAVKGHALALRRGLQPFTSQHDAGLDQFLVVLTHGG